MQKEKAQQNPEPEKLQQEEIQQRSEEKIKREKNETGIFTDIPRVRTYDYDGDVKGKV